jgi:hypothetical protein
LNDLGEKADIALVMGTPESNQTASDQPLMDLVVKLFNAGDFPTIIVSGSKLRDGANEPQAMANYLETKGIPESAILMDEAETTAEATKKAAKMMKEHDANSVMVITDYYHVTLMKLGLIHDGVTSLQKAHIGKLSQDDAVDIGREIVAIYDYVGHAYLLPAAEKIKDEAKVGADKASVDAEEAKKKMDNSLNSFSK